MKIRLALLGAVFALAPLEAAEAKWVQLGVKVVNHVAEKDTIAVGAVEGRFTKLKLAIHQKGIHIFDLKIKFGDGTTRDVALKKIFRAGEETRDIVFKKPRVIRAVVLKYKTRGRRRRRAKVEVLGFKAAAVVKKKGPLIKWKVLGVKKVGFRVDRDVIKVTAAEGIYTKIRLKVDDSPVRFRDLKVVFGNGEKIDIPVKKHFKPGDKTRVIDLPGKARIIQKVIMWYDTKGFRGRATVTLMGGKVAGTGKPGPKPVVGGKWHLMGTRKVAHRTERDEIGGLLKGRFRKLKVKVLKRGIKIKRIKITFGNGETKIFRADKVVRAGEELGPYDCPGSARVIKSVVFWYQTRGRPRGPRAVIELHGKK